MIGPTIGRYRIVEKLGEGGMGVVYRAEDTRLHRTVALKFLAPALVDNPEERQRLINEARTIASINHPNICTIYGIDELEGRTFIATEYVEGSTLRDRVLSGEIGIAKALRVATEIAEGLREAHSRDIVHRDIKSANIMINPAGQAVIMDFGLVRREEQMRPDEQFISGSTSAYMSPEQARGERVDQRTDIWSVGVVLYEMLAGELPFRGDYEQAVVYSIINQPPRDLVEARPGVPARVVEVVARALQKDPTDRFPSLDEFVGAVAGELDRITGARPVVATASRRRRGVGWATAVAAVVLVAFVTYRALRVDNAASNARVPIAVSDFDNTTGDPVLDGLSGMLITALEQPKLLSVVTRSRMFDLLKTMGRGNVEHIDESLRAYTIRRACISSAFSVSIPGSSARCNT